MNNFKRKKYGCEVTPVLPKKVVIEGTYEQVQKVVAYARTNKVVECFKASKELGFGVGEIVDELIEIGLLEYVDGGTAKWIESNPIKFYYTYAGRGSGGGWSMSELFDTEQQAIDDREKRDPKIYTTGWVEKCKA